MKRNIGLLFGLMMSAFMPSSGGLSGFMPNITYVGGRGDGTPIYIPYKHHKQTYGQQRRKAKKRNNIRKFN